MIDDGAEVGEELGAILGSRSNRAGTRPRVGEPPGEVPINEVGGVGQDLGKSCGPEIGMKVEIDEAGFFHPDFPDDAFAQQQPGQGPNDPLRE